MNWTTFAKDKETVEGTGDNLEQVIGIDSQQYGEGDDSEEESRNCDESVKDLMHITYISLNL